MIIENSYSCIYVQFEKVDWDTKIAWEINDFIKNDIPKPMRRFLGNSEPKRWLIYKTAKEFFPKLYEYRERAKLIGEDMSGIDKEIQDDFDKVFDA